MAYATAPALNALHALRITLRRSQSAAPSRLAPGAPSLRPFATAVLHDAAASFAEASPVQSTSTAWLPRHAASDVVYPSPTDFLEEPFLDDAAACEYRTASLTLPPRRVVPLHWPYGATAALEAAAAAADAQVAVTPRRCDTLAHLVVAGDLVTARTVYDELKALHIGITHRAVYLPAAVSCLDGTPQGLDAFLFWFRLVPNVPAVRPHPDLKSRFAPLIDALLTHHTYDTDAINRVMLAAGHKGLLPALLGPLSRHLAHIVDPHTLVSMADAALEAYALSTTGMSSASTTLRAQAHAALCRMRTHEAWNAIARSLGAAGWTRAAVEVVEAREWVEWTDYTLAELGARIEREAGVTQVSLGTTEDERKVKERPGMSRLARFLCAARVNALSPAAMVEMLNELETRGRYGLVERLVRRYEKGAAKGRVDAAWERMVHARLIALRLKGEHGEVLERFAEAYHWVGLPQHPVLAKGRRGADEASLETDAWTRDRPPHTSRSSWVAYSSIEDRPRKLYPNAPIISTIMASLFYLLPTGRVASFASDYLALVTGRSFAASVAPAADDASTTPTESVNASSLLAHDSTHTHTLALAPRLRPTHATIGAVLRQVCHRLGPQQGYDALRELSAAGIDPGIDAYNAVVWAYGGRGNVERALEMVDDMEAERVMHGAEAEADAEVEAEVQAGDASDRSARVVRMPRPYEPTIMGLAGIVERSGRAFEAHAIRTIHADRLAREMAAGIGGGEGEGEGEGEREGEEAVAAMTPAQIPGPGPGQPEERGAERWRDLYEALMSDEERRGDLDAAIKELAMRKARMKRNSVKRRKQWVHKVARPRAEGRSESSEEKMVE